MTGLGRYHLLLMFDGRPSQHGYWDVEAVARSKCLDWVGDWGCPGARITLVDEETGTLLTEWPEESRSSGMLPA